MRGHLVSINLCFWVVLALAGGASCQGNEPPPSNSSSPPTTTPTLNGTLSVFSDRINTTISSSSSARPKCFSDPTTARTSTDATSCLILNKQAYRDATLKNATLRASITCGKSTAITQEKLGTCTDAQATLDAHNTDRAKWGAAPLLWSKTLADYAQSVSNTCVFAHSNGPYGENLAIGTGLGGCAQAVNLWYAESSAWPPGGSPGFSSSTGHFSQLVWKATTQVGCAVTSCSGKGLFVTCSYNPPGNVIGQFSAQVGTQGETPECTSTSGGSSGSGSGPPSSSPTASTPAPIFTTTPMPTPSPRPIPSLKKPYNRKKHKCCIYENICFTCYY